MEEREMPMLWNYRARLVRIVDGDTIDVIIDLGYGLQIGHDPRTRMRLRLLGVNTPEMKGATLVAGRAAKAYVEEWLEQAAIDSGEWPLIIHTEKPDAFGRYLAYIHRTCDGRRLNDDLVETDHAVIDIRAIPPEWRP